MRASILSAAFAALLSLSAAPALAAWKQRWMPRLAALEAMEDRSLFSPAMLRRRLSR